MFMVPSLKHASQLSFSSLVFYFIDALWCFLCKQMKVMLHVCTVWGSSDPPKNTVHLQTEQHALLSFFKPLFFSKSVNVWGDNRFFCILLVLEKHNIILDWQHWCSSERTEKKHVVHRLIGVCRDAETLKKSCLCGKKEWRSHGEAGPIHQHNSAWGLLKSALPFDSGYNTNKRLSFACNEVTAIKSSSAHVRCPAATRHNF